MTALITSLHSHHLGNPQWCPFRPRSLSLRCPFKHSTKPAVSAPDLLTLNLGLGASASRASSATIRPLDRLSVGRCHVEDESPSEPWGSLPQGGAKSSAKCWSKKREFFLHLGFIFQWVNKHCQILIEAHRTNWCFKEGARRSFL